MNSSAPKPAVTGVSYVVTVYNKAGYLPLVIEGLRRQEGDFEREFIFVDDGSTDDSVAIIERETADLPNVVVVKQRNAGPSWALNAGLARTRLPWIKGLDGDDVPSPWATKLLLTAAQGTGCPVAFGGHLTFRPGEDPFEKNREALTALATAPVRIERPLDRLVDGRLFGNPSCWLAERKEILAAGGCDPAVFIQDVSITLRLAARTCFAVIEDPVFMAPQEEETRLTGNQMQILHDVSRAYANFFAQHPEIPADLKRRAAKRLTGRAWKWAKRKRGAGLGSPDFRRHLLCQFGFGDPVAQMDASCTSFVGDIRVPPADRSAPELPKA